MSQIKKRQRQDGNYHKLHEILIIGLSVGVSQAILNRFLEHHFYKTFFTPDVLGGIISRGIIFMIIFGIGFSIFPWKKSAKKSQRSPKDHELLEPIRNIPQSSVGAPEPVVLSNELYTGIAFYAEDETLGEDNIEPVVIVHFERCLAKKFGPPGDEIIFAHHLAAKGLKPYSFFVIRNSSWIQELEKMNSAHPHHDSASFAKYNHYIFSFHDATFECIADKYEIEIVNKPMNKVLDMMKNNLGI